jgi:hypothetical protein
MRSAVPLILPLRNHRSHVASAQPAPQARKAVCLVTRQRVRALPGSPARQPDPDRLEHRLEGLALLPLAAGEVEREREAPAVSHEVDLGAEAPARAAQGVIS